MNLPQLSRPISKTYGAVTLIAAALYLLLGLYSGHLMICGAELRGHEDGELVHLKSDADGPNWRNERPVIGTAVAGEIVADSGGSPEDVATVVPGPLVAAIFLTFVLFLSCLAPVRRPPQRRTGQPVGRWHRAVVLLI